MPESCISLKMSYLDASDDINIALECANDVWGPFDDKRQGNIFNSKRYSSFNDVQTPVWRAKAAGVLALSPARRWLVLIKNISLVYKIFPVQNKPYELAKSQGGCLGRTTVASTSQTLWKCSPIKVFATRERFFWIYYPYFFFLSEFNVLHIRRPIATYG